jgi:nucleoid DNA-binding protein
MNEEFRKIIYEALNFDMEFPENNSLPYIKEEWVKYILQYVIDGIKTHLKYNEYLIIENFGRFEKRVLRKSKERYDGKKKQWIKGKERLGIRFIPCRTYIKEINKDDR